MKKHSIKIIAGAIVTLLMSGGGAAYATSTKESNANDHVLVGTQHDFEEYFKRDSGDRSIFKAHDNYLYTTSVVVDAPPPGKCLIATGDSEKTITMWCNDGNGGR